MYEFETTDWCAIKKHIQNKHYFSELIKSIGLSSNVARKVATDFKYSNDFFMRVNAIKEAGLNMKSGIPFIIHIFGEMNNTISLKDLLEKLKKCSGKVELLEKYLDYKTFRDKCIACGLKELVLAIEKMTLKT